MDAFFLSEEELDNVIMANFPHSVQYRIKYNSVSQFGFCSAFFYMYGVLFYKLQKV